MIRLSSFHLPRARALLDAFRAEGLPASNARLSPSAEAARQRSPGGWPVPRDRLAAQLQQRLDGRTLMHQRGTSYCGCAAFLYCVLKDRPDWYVAYATALWRGIPFTFASNRARLKVDSTEGTRRALAQIHGEKVRGPFISDLDWMTMACLSSATRWSKDAGPSVATPSDRGAAITWPWMVKQWFASVGAPAVLDSVGFGLARSSLAELLELLDRWAGHWLVMQIDSSLLEGGASSPLQRHWIVVDSERQPLIQPAGGQGGLLPGAFSTIRSLHERALLAQVRDAYAGQAVVDEETRLDHAALTNLRVVSWGDEHYHLYTPTIGYVADKFYGGYAFPRF